MLSLINVYYLEKINSISLNCSTEDDLKSLRPILRDFKTLSLEQGLIIIKVSEVEKLNQALIPVKHLLKIDTTFTDWRTGYLTNRPVTIKVGVINSKIIGGNHKLPHKEIEEATRYFLKAAVNMDKYKSGKWDGFINLYHRWDHTFPTGLIDDVRVALTRKGIPFEVDYCYDRFPKKQFNWTIDDGIIPDEDQLEAVKLSTGQRGVLKAPTGFGKTAVLAKRLMVAHSVPTLFIANRKSLLDDAANEFRNGVIGLDPKDVIQIKDGLFGDIKLSPTIKEVNPLKGLVVVATIQSLSARLKDERTRPHLLYWLHTQCKFIMVDETQAVGTKIWDEVLNEVWAPYRIFLSATPRRTDGATLKIMAGSGPILFTTTAEEQIEKGRLCDVDIFYKVFDQAIYNENDSDVQYIEMYRPFIMENERRNREIVVEPAMEMIAEERHILVLIQNIDHGHLLKQMFLDAGLNTEDVMFIWGDTPDKIRTQAIEKFKRGEFKVMIGSTIFDAGVNIPIISGVILAGAGNSDITLIQRIGRGVRNCDYMKLLGYIPKFVKDNNGIKKAKIIDALDTNIKFFHTQSKNRYYNACAEFGAERVHIINGDKSALRKVSKTSKKISDEIDQFSSQLAMLNEFKK